MRKTFIIAAATALLSLCAAGADPAPETILVKKGDIEVTAGDFLAFIAKLPESQRFTYRADLDRITAAASSIYLARELAREARAEGVDKDPEIQRRMRLAEEQMLAQLYIERFEKSIKTPDYEAHALEVYKADWERYRVPEKVQLNSILVSFQGRTPEEAKRRADEARAKLVAGDAFARVARDYSNDPNFVSNGGLYQGSYNRFDPEVATYARVADIGKPSQPILTPEGYRVVVILERLPEQVVPFEKVKKGLVEAEQAKYRKDAIDKKLGSITQSKDIMLNTDAIASLKTEIDREELRRLHEELAAKEAQEKRRALGETAKPPGQ